MILPLSVVPFVDRHISDLTSTKRYYERLCNNRQLINSHFYRGALKLPCKLGWSALFVLAFGADFLHNQIGATYDDSSKNNDTNIQRIKERLFYSTPDNRIKNSFPQASQRPNHHQEHCSHRDKSFFHSNTSYNIVAIYVINEQIGAALAPAWIHRVHVLICLSRGKSCETI